MDSETPSSTVPKEWRDAIARADADYQAGRLVDAVDVKKRIQASLARMVGESPLKRTA